MWFDQPGLSDLVIIVSYHPPLSSSLIRVLFITSSSSLIVSTPNGFDISLYCQDSDWLIKAVTLVISDFTGLHRCEVHERVARDLPDQYRLLTQEATLDMELGEALWRDYDPHVRGQITLMMVHLGLAVHLRSGQYLIPALLPPESSQSSQQTPHDHHDSVRVRRSCLFHFRIRTGRVEGAGARVGGQACGLLAERDLYGGFMPDGLFARVVAKCVGWS